MTKPRLVLRRSPEERRQYRQQRAHGGRHKHVGEVVGGTTAEMAAVCCCFPCSLVDLMVLTMYKVPTGLYKNAMRRRRQPTLTMKRSDSFSSIGSFDDSELSMMHPAVIAAAERFVRPQEVDKDFMELENEMWEKFHDGGFWRSPSGKFDGLS